MFSVLYSLDCMFDFVQCCRIIVVEDMADPVDDDTASDDVEQRVWDAVAVDGGLLEKRGI